MTHAHGAAEAQREATVIGWVAGTPIPRERLDARVRELRAGRLAGRLPAVGSKEDRQFLRWTAQVLLTEELCRVELARMRAEAGIEAAPVADEPQTSARSTAFAADELSGRASGGYLAAGELPGRASGGDLVAGELSGRASGSDLVAGELSGRASGSDLAAGELPGRASGGGARGDALADSELFAAGAAAAIASSGPEAAAPPAAVRPLTQVESLHLGSINAAAWSTCPAMSALYQLVTEPTPAASPAAPPTCAPTRTWYRVTHAVAATALEAATATETSLGWTTLDDLPAALAAELRLRPQGTRVGPVRTGLGWHFATVTATEARAAGSVRPADAADPTRLAAFNRWLDQRRRDLVTHAPGFEHPGDPSQPDNTHRH